MFHVTSRSGRRDATPAALHRHSGTGSMNREQGDRQQPKKKKPPPRRTPLISASVSFLPTMASSRDRSSVTTALAACTSACGAPNGNHNTHARVTNQRTKRVSAWVKVSLHYATHRIRLLLHLRQQVLRFQRTNPNKTSATRHHKARQRRRRQASSVDSKPRRPPFNGAKPFAPLLATTHSQQLLILLVEVLLL